MLISRRHFLLLTAGVAAGCAVAACGADVLASDKHTVNAGSATAFEKEGVYSTFRNQGFFIIRKDGKLLAISAICTHKNCKLTPEKDRSFLCKCHGSTFDPDGHVTQGPAKRDLPVFQTSINDKGELIVKLP